MFSTGVMETCGALDSSALARFSPRSQASRSPGLPELELEQRGAQPVGGVWACDRPATTSSAPIRPATHCA